jgi:leader peptidase (prepilin peptidase)/N-methyltransferase
MHEFFTLPSLPWPFWVVWAGIVGAMAGSFFNVVIYRMPRGESVVSPPSQCPRCGHRIRPWENIPVFSWLVILRGKCSGCSLPISVQYPLVEAATGLWAAAWAAWLLLGDAPPDPGFRIALLYFTLCCIPITVIDLRHYLIPDVLTLPGIALGCALALLPGGLAPWEGLLGAVVAGGGLWLIGFTASLLLRKEAMGLGDVKLLAMAGAAFGWQPTLLGLGIASVLGTIGGLPLLLFRKLNEERHLPFGPFICAGVLVALVVGDPLVKLYFRMAGFETE